MDYGLWNRDMNHTMDEGVKQFHDGLIDTELEADRLSVARIQSVENSKERNRTREALTALRKIARTTKSSVQSPFESVMNDIGRHGSRPALVKEVCTTCGNYDSSEPTWMILPGTDMFAAIPFHAVHTMLEKDQEKLDFESKKLQSYVKEKALRLSEMGVLVDKISPAVMRSMVTLTDKSDQAKLANKS